jgi:hypothetical protein
MPNLCPDLLLSEGRTPKYTEGKRRTTVAESNPTATVVTYPGYKKLPISRQTNLSTSPPEINIHPTEISEVTNQFQGPNLAASID